MYRMIDSQEIQGIVFVFTNLGQSEYGTQANIDRIF